MHPTLESGVFVVVLRWQFWGWNQKLQVDDVVAVNHTKYGQIVKRISQIDYGKNNQVAALRLSGDNESASVTEVQMGWVGVDDLIGRVVYVVRAG